MSHTNGEIFATGPPIDTNSAWWVNMTLYVPRKASVDIRATSGGVAIRLTVETEGARSIIADAQPRLMAEARAQGVRVAEAHVDLAGARDHAAGDQRRHEDGRQNATIRTARGPAGEGDAAAPERRGTSERYA